MVYIVRRGTVVVPIMHACKMRPYSGKLVCYALLHFWRGNRTRALPWAARQETLVGS